MRSKRNFSTSSDPSSAISFDRESCPRPQKIELAEEPQTQSVDRKEGDGKPMVGRRVKESRVVAPRMRGKK